MQASFEVMWERKKKFWKEIIAYFSFTAVQQSENLSICVMNSSKRYNLGGYNVGINTLTNGNNSSS